MKIKKSMATWIMAAILVSSAWCKDDASTASGPLRVLVFSKVAGFYHNTIDDIEAALTRWGASHNWTVTKSRDDSQFTDSNLAKYDVVVWNNNCMSGQILPNEGLAAFQRYIHGGGGYAGIHGAAYCYFTPTWTFYTDSLVGAREVNTGPCHLGGVCSLFVAVNDPVTSMFPAKYTLNDEYYSLTDDITKRLFPNKADTFQVVLVAKKLDVDASCTDFRNGTHPVSWRHTFYSGRAFYTMVGHETSTINDSVFLKHFCAGIQWVGTKQASGAVVRPDVRRKTPGKFSFTCGKAAYAWNAASLPVDAVMILDMRGKLVYSQSVKGLSFSWNGIGVNGVRAPKGIYCFCGKTAGTDIVKTFVKQD